MSDERNPYCSDCGGTGYRPCRARNADGEEYTDQEPCNCAPDAPLLNPSPAMTRERLDLAELRRLHEGMFGRVDPATAMPQIVAALPALLSIAEAAEAQATVHECGCGYCEDLRAALAPFRKEHQE